MVTVGDMNELMSAFGMKADSITVSDRVVGNSLLIAGRIQNRVFPEVILERIAATGGVCKVSVGEGVVIEMDKEIAEETVYIISSLGEQNIELDIEEVEKERLTCIMGADLFPVISVHDSFASVLVGRMMYFNDMAAEQYNLRK